MYILPELRVPNCSHLWLIFAEIRMSKNVSNVLEQVYCNAAGQNNFIQQKSQVSGYEIFKSFIQLLMAIYIVTLQKDFIIRNIRTNIPFR